MWGHVLKNTVRRDPQTLVVVFDLTCDIEHTYSVLRWLKNYLRSTIKQDRLNNCPLMHCYKSIILWRLDIVKIAKRFVCANKQGKGHFGKFEWGYVDGFQNAPLPLSLQYMQYITKLQPCAFDFAVAMISVTVKRYCAWSLLYNSRWAPTWSLFIS